MRAVPGARARSSPKIPRSQADAKLQVPGFEREFLELEFASLFGSHGAGPGPPSGGRARGGIYQLIGIWLYLIRVEYWTDFFHDNDKRSKNICTKMLDFLFTAPTVRIRMYQALPGTWTLAAASFNQLFEVDMKTLLTAFACVTLLAACKKDEPAPVVAEPAVVVPADATTTPAETAPPAQATDAPPVSSSSGSSAAGATEGSGGGMYVVNRGDTLWNIAEKNGISHGDLAKWNNINDPRELQVGRELRLTAP